MAKRFLSDVSFEGTVEVQSDADGPNEVVRKSQLDSAIAGVGGGGGGPQTLFIQETEPASATPYIWYKTDSTGKVVDIRKGPI